MKFKYRQEKLQKKAFTLSEELIVLGIIGVVAAVLSPAIMALRPDSTAIKFRKAYSTLEKAVNDLISNDVYYPSANLGDATVHGSTLHSYPQGFADNTTTDLGIPANNNKFCYLLSQELNLSGDADCNQATNDLTPIFTTMDGAVWYFPHASTFTANDSVPIPVSVDVNGSNKGANCNAPNSYGYVQCAAGQVQDIFIVNVRFDGKLSINPQDIVAPGYLATPTKKSSLEK